MCVKINVIDGDHTADDHAAHDAAHDIAARRSASPGNGDTSSSSMCLPNFAPKNDDTTLPYEFVITDIMIRPGAMY